MSTEKKIALKNKLDSMTKKLEKIQKYSKALVDQNKILLENLEGANGNEIISITKDINENLILTRKLEKAYTILEMKRDRLVSMLSDKTVAHEINTRMDELQRQSQALVKEVENLRAALGNNQEDSREILISIALNEKQQRRIMREYDALAKKKESLFDEDEDEDENF